MAAYSQYLRQLPAGRHVSEATSKLAEYRNAMDETLFCESQHSFSGLTRFVETHPASKFTDNAQALLAIMTSNVTVKVKPPPELVEALTANLKSSTMGTFFGRVC